jgi:hypothetical protein
MVVNGFVTSAPSDYGGSTGGADNRVRCGRFQAPADGTITDMGIYCNAGGAGNMEFGIYSDNSGEPGTLLEKCSPFAKGTDAGYKTASGFSTSITNGTYYWLAWAMDNTTADTNMLGDLTGGTMRYETGITSLESTWDTASDTSSSFKCSIYAIYSAGAPAFSGAIGINIGDTFKEISGASVILVNIGDVWKDVTDAYINIGDAWKKVYG